MAVLVTGGAGYIGSHAALRLVEKGEQVVVLDDLSTGRRALIPPQAKFVEGNVGDSDLLKSLFERERIDAVLHFAGSIVVPDSVTEPLGYYGNNTCNSRNLIEAAVGASVRAFIFSSTAAVYGSPDLVPIGEESRLSPINPYGRSKLMTEWMLEDASAAHGLPYMALRYFNVAGADPKGRSGQASPKATHLIKVACEVVTGKRARLEIFGTDYPTRDGTCVRDYIHVTDLVEAHILALDALRNGMASSVFNCGYGRGYTVLEVVGSLERVLGRPIEKVLSGRRAGDPAELVARSQRIQEVLGWRPQLNDIDLIVKTALEWEKRLQNF